MVERHDPACCPRRMASEACRRQLTSIACAIVIAPCRFMQVSLPRRAHSGEHAMGPRPGLTCNGLEQDIDGRAATVPFRPAVMRSASPAQSNGDRPARRPALPGAGGSPSEPR